MPSELFPPTHVDIHFNGTNSIHYDHVGDLF